MAHKKRRAGAVWTPQKRRPARDRLSGPGTTPAHTRKTRGPVAPVPPGWVYFESIDPPLAFQCQQGEQPPQISEGYGGFETTDRTRRQGIVEWKRGVPYKMPVSLLFDGHATDSSVEGGIRILEAMARIDGGNSQPPVIGAYGALPRSGNVDWVIEGIEWGNAIWHPAGFRTRQAATVNLLELTDDELIKKSPAKRRKARGKGRGHARTYTVRHGDTISSIAARELGSAAKWHEIQKLNHLRDPKHLRVGQRLKLP